MLYAGHRQTGIMKGVYAAGAVDFDGASSYMSRLADFTGAVDGGEYTLSVWLKFIGGDGAAQTVFDDGEDHFFIYRMASNKYYFAARSPGSDAEYQGNSNSAWNVSSGWHHILMAGQASTLTNYFYVNAADDEASGATEANRTIDFTTGDFRVGAWHDARDKLNASVADFWLAHTFLDISDPDVLGKFIGPDFKPVDLGEDGSKPGATPIAFFRHEPGESPTDFAINRGTGGDMTIIGELTESATSPTN